MATGYAYDHDAEDGFSGQNYFPEGHGAPGVTMRRWSGGLNESCANVWPISKSCAPAAKVDKPSA